MNVIAVDAEKVSEFKLEITHVVTNGCSWTYCQGLPNITTQGWPALVAKELNTPLVNLALPGVGNDSIFRRTYEYIYNNLSTGSVPLVIIAWTMPWRREGWYKKHFFQRNYNDYAVIARPDLTTSLDHYQEALLENWNEEDFQRKTLLYKLSLINLLENLNIPYLMTNYAHQYHGVNEPEKIKNSFPEMVNRINNKYTSMEEFHVLLRDYPKLDCGHDGVEGQQILSKYIIDKIKEVHSDLKFVNDKPFYSLKDYLPLNKNHQKFPEWCNFKL